MIIARIVSEDFVLSPLFVRSGAKCTALDTTNLFDQFQILAGWPARKNCCLDAPLAVSYLSGCVFCRKPGVDDDAPFAANGTRYRDRGRGRFATAIQGNGSGQECPLYTLFQFVLEVAFDHVE